MLTDHMLENPSGGETKKYLTSIIAWIEAKEGQHSKKSNFLLWIELSNNLF